MPPYGPSEGRTMMPALQGLYLMLNTRKEMIPIPFQGSIGRGPSWNTQPSSKNNRVSCLEPGLRSRHL